MTVDGAPVTFTQNPDGTITIVLPPHAAGEVIIVVTTPGGSTGGVPFTYYDTPVIGGSGVVGLAPDFGPTAGGTTVIITGTGFAGVTSVDFGDIAARSFTVDSATQITAVTEAHAAGAVDVVVTNPVTESDPATYTYIAPADLTPTISTDGLAPTSGPTTGGTLVGITGTNFIEDATVVTIGGFTVPAAEVDVLSPTSLTFTTPAHAAGAVNVTVATEHGTSSPQTFTYITPAGPTPVIDADGIDPSSGPTDGGQTVTITGEYFVVGATTVVIDGTEVPATATDTTTLTFVTPAHVAGGVDVAVKTADGTSAPQRYTYVATPVIVGPGGSIGLSPVNGPTAGGTVVTVTGENFVAGATSVTIGGLEIIASLVTVTSPEQLTFVTPPYAAGDVSVTVSTAGGTSNAETFTYTDEAPVLAHIDTISPAAGPDTGGTVVTLTGTGFDDATAVVIDGVEIRDFTVGEGTITFTTPAHVSAIVSVTVLTEDGSSNGVDYIYEEGDYGGGPVAPWIYDIAPTSGSTEGGTVVTVRGSDFTDVTKVEFDFVAGTSLTVIDDSTLTVVTPPHVAGEVPVVVTSDAGSGRPAWFTYVEPGTEPSAPVVTGMVPVQGPVAGGTEVTITGSGFTGATTVSFGDVTPETRAVVTDLEIGTNTAAFTVVSDTEILAVTPPHAEGPVDVRLETPGGTTSAGTFTYLAAELPVISGLSPSEGSTAGGTEVVVSGTGLENTENVWVGGTPVPFVKNPDGSLTITMPPHAAGTVEIVVETAAGASNGATFTYVVPGDGGPSGTPGGPTGSGSPSVGQSGGGGALPATGSSGTGTFGAVLFAFALLGSGAALLIRRRTATTR